MMCQELMNPETILGSFLMEVFTIELWWCVILLPYASSPSAAITWEHAGKRDKCYDYTHTDQFAEARSGG